MKYNDLKISYEVPYIWKRPSKDKLPKEGLSYNGIKKSEEEFVKLKEGVKDEIGGHLKQQVDASKDRNELNKNLDAIMEFYGKAIIPTEEVDPKFLLTKTNKNTLNKKLQG